MENLLIKIFCQKKIIIPVFLLLLIVGGFESVTVLYNKPENSSPIVYGVSYSPDYATSLGLDWKKTYISILDKLHIKNLRLPTYWEDLETTQNKYDFSQTDFLVNEAAKRQASIIMVVGTKQPRWPECHIPEWALSMSRTDRQKRVFEYIQTVISRYKNNKSIWAWQVENEPFFQFGENCDPIDSATVSQEIQLVKSIDPTRPVIVTDTGEWRPWIVPMQLSDILGVSVYTRAYLPMFGNFRYPFTPEYYLVKSNLIRQLFASKNQKTIITELQAEAWTQNFIGDTPLDQQIQLFSAHDLEYNVEFAQKIGFSPIYLWGVEWWYYMNAHNHPEYLNYIRSLLK